MALELRDADPTAVVMAVTREGSALYDAVETAAPTLEPLAGLLGARLPRRLHVPLVPGRGFLVTGGELTLCQIAVPDE